MTPPRETSLNRHDQSSFDWNEVAEDLAVDFQGDTVARRGCGCAKALS